MRARAPKSFAAHSLNGLKLYSRRSNEFFIYEMNSEKIRTHNFMPSMLSVSSDDGQVHFGTPIVIAIGTEIWGNAMRIVDRWMLDVLCAQSLALLLQFIAGARSAYFNVNDDDGWCIIHLSERERERVRCPMLDRNLKLFYVE